MSEQWHPERLDDDHLWGLIEHAQSQIEMWTRRQEIAMGHLATRGVVLQEYPTSN